jgi:hypothetical protein
MAETPEMEEKSWTSSEHLSSAQLLQYLKDVDFPTDKDKVISAAKSNEAPENVMQYLNQLPDKQYDFLADIEEEFGKIM